MTDQAPKDVFRQTLDAELVSIDGKIAALEHERKEIERRAVEVNKETSMLMVRSTFVALRIADAEESKKRLMKLANVATAPLINATTRDAVRREQALRARLSKTDMNQEARRKVLEEGRAAGILTPQEAAELELGSRANKPSLSVTVRSTPTAESDEPVPRRKRRAMVTRQEKRATKKRKVAR